MSSAASIDFILGSRRIASVDRDLATWGFGLEETLNDGAPLTPPASGLDGLRVLSAPQSRMAEIVIRFPDHLLGSRQDFRRHYIAMEGNSFEDYLEGFSSKTRSTLRRKARKLAKEAGDYTLTEHRTRAEVETFLDAALPLSAKTYQARLLDAGLPDSPENRQSMLEAAERGQMRCFLLWVGKGPIAYLSLPVIGKTLVYAHLGYDPEYARLSPGTVLQLLALEPLFAENAYAFFDFTEGEGAHKAMFGTDSVECSSFVLLRPTIANRALLSARTSFDAVVEVARSVAQRTGVFSRIRSALRA